MRFKVNIEIVTGFLGAGKTSFINALLENSIIEQEKVLVVQCEQGEKSIREHIKEGSEVIIQECNPLEALTIDYLKKVIDLYKPHRMIIEHNGSRDIYELIDLLGKAEVSKMCKLLSIYNVTDALTYDMFINNMGNLILDPIYNSNLIILNNTESISEEKSKSIVKQLRNFNLDAFIISVSNINCVSSVLEESDLLYKGIMKKLTLFMKNLLSD